MQGRRACTADLTGSRGTSDHRIRGQARTPVPVPVPVHAHGCSGNPEHHSGGEVRRALHQRQRSSGASHDGASRTPGRVGSAASATRRVSAIRGLVWSGGSGAGNDGSRTPCLVRSALRGSRQRSREQQDREQLAGS